MSRGERRQRTEKVAKRRFEEAEVLSRWVIDDKTEGHYRKKNPFTFPKVPKRQWFKLQKERHARFKDDRRNGEDDGGTGGIG